MYNKILVTGGSGMVGKSLQRITKEDTRFVFVSSKDADLTDLEQTSQLFQKVKPDAVIHLASIVGGMFFNMQNNAKILDLNTRINLNVTRSCVESDVKKVILVNSTCAFPSTPQSYPMTESDLHQGPVHSSNKGFGASKRICEIVGRLYSESSDTKFITVYPCNLYGPNDNFNSETCHVLSSLINRAHDCLKNQQDLIVWGSGKPLRQFLFVEDFARLLILTLEQSEEITSTGVIMCNTSDELSINELAEKIRKVVGLKGVIVNDTSKSDGLFKKTVSNKLFLEAYPDFEFTTLDEGLKRTYDWYIHNCV